MSYLSQAQLANDSGFLNRVAACAASEDFKDPHAWAWAHNWRLSARPSFDAKYASAKLTYEQWDPESGTPQPPPPGENEGAITDGNILSAVQFLANQDEQE